MSKKNIKDYTLEELKKLMDEIREPSYRAKQIFFWLYQRGVCSFNEMDNIPKGLKSRLGRDYYIGALELCEHLKSADKGEKFLFKLRDGNFIETVLIYAKGRKTACLSTQVGCKFACLFCASGGKGFVRNLKPSEITNQIMFLQHNLKHRLTNFVFMGMGEPLDNFTNVSKALMIMNAPQALGIGARRITISTCGIIPGIEKLKGLGLQINLSVSLHAGNDKLRDTLIPVNRRYPLARLIKACEDFKNKTGRMISLEYVLIKDKNDSPQNADELAEIAKRLKAKVNLIPCSRIPNLKLESAQRKAVVIFMRRLLGKRVKATLRHSRGEDIQAACGQLAGRVK